MLGGVRKNTRSRVSFWKVLIKLSDVDDTALSLGSVKSHVVRRGKFQGIVVRGEDNCWE